MFKDNHASSQIEVADLEAVIVKIDDSVIYSMVYIYHIREGAKNRLRAGGGGACGLPGPARRRRHDPTCI